MLHYWLFRRPSIVVFVLVVSCLSLARPYRITAQPPSSSSGNDPVVAAGLSPHDWQSIRSLLPPPGQQAYFKASNTDANDQFGFSVSVSRETVVVGVPLEASAATGINGDQSDNGVTAAGAAYVFVRSGRTWVQQAYLKASNTGVSDAFGISVAVAGDTIVVGAPGESSAATGVNGNQADNSTNGSGAAYVFVRIGNTWTQQAYLKASNTDVGDYFGTSVALYGDTIVVGAPNEASAATGVNSNQGDNAAMKAGAAYVFTRSLTTWSQQAYLKASNTDVNDQFGFNVNVSGDTVVVAAPEEASAATGINGDQADNTAKSAGAAYVFVRSGTAWSQQAYLKASNTGSNDFFGYSAAVSGNTVVVGAPAEASAATGINGDQTNNAAPVSGAAYVFVWSGTAWSQQAYLKASNTDANDQFGLSVTISGDTVVVGAPWEASAAVGVNGNQADDTANGAGAAYMFVRSGIDWTQQTYLPFIRAAGILPFVTLNDTQIPAHPVTNQGEVFFTNTVTVPASLPADGTFFLSSSPTSLQGAVVDDAVVFTIGGQQIWHYDYGADGLLNPKVVTIPRTIMDQIAGQQLIIELKDIYGASVQSTPLYIVYQP